MTQVEVFVSLQLGGGKKTKVQLGGGEKDNDLWYVG